jgi:hypothetical protein
MDPVTEEHRKGRKKLRATFAELKAAVISIGRIPGWNKSDLLSYLNQYTTDKYYTDHRIDSEQEVIDRLLTHYELDNFQVLKLLPTIRERKAEYNEINNRNKYFKKGSCGHCEHKPKFDEDENTSWDATEYKDWKTQATESIKQAINNKTITLEEIHKILDEWRAGSI